MQKTSLKLFGRDNLEGEVFTRCTTYEKAIELLREEGFEDEIEIIQEELPLNVIEIGDNLIQV